MAGFRTFATGEVLTAANVNNFLMGQSVMRFADADARTAALGADVVEGMLTYNLATDQLEVFDGTNFVVAAPEPPAGIGSNVVQTVKTDTFTTTFAGNTDRVAITGLAAAITPSSATSKVLVTVHLHAAVSADAGIAVLTRNGTEIARGDASSSRGRHTAYIPVKNTSFSSFSVSFSFLDDPATTSSTTYAVDVGPGFSSTNTCFVNRTETDTDSSSSFRGISSITVVEVAA